MLNYVDIGNKGWVVYGPLAKDCLTHRTEEAGLIVLVKPTLKDFVVATTPESGFHLLRTIANIETLLNHKHGALSIENLFIDNNTLALLYGDAENIDESLIAAFSETDRDTEVLCAFKDLVADAISNNATDIHWRTEIGSSRVAYRIGGDIALDYPINVHEANRMMSASIQKWGIGLSGQDFNSRKVNLAMDLTVMIFEDGGSRGENVRLRVDRTGSKHSSGWKFTARIHRAYRQHKEISDLSYEVWMENKLKGILHKPNGIFLATGKTASGKTTLIHLLLESMPHEMSGVSIEDPIEIKHSHPNIYQIEVDDNNPDYQLDRLLKDSLRQDPDFINAPEVRTPNTALQMFSHARTGMVVTSTLHAKDSITAFDRLINLGVGAADVSNQDLILGVLSQKLLKRLCSFCAISFEFEGRTVYRRNSDGCAHCRGNYGESFHGFMTDRIAVAELLIPKACDAHFIKNQLWGDWLKKLLSEGFKTMALRALELSSKKVICFDNALTSIPNFSEVLDHEKHYKK